MKTLNNLTSIDLNELSSFASLFFTANELAIIFDVCPKAFKKALDDPSTEIYRVVTAAKLKAEAEVRQATFLLAKNGSTQGIAHAKEIIKKFKMEQDE